MFTFVDIIYFSFAFFNIFAIFRCILYLFNKSSNTIFLFRIKSLDIIESKAWIINLYMWRVCTDWFKILINVFLFKFSISNTFTFDIVSRIGRVILWSFLISMKRKWYWIGIILVTPIYIRYDSLVRKIKNFIRDINGSC